MGVSVPWYTEYIIIHTVERNSYKPYLDDLIPHDLLLVLDEQRGDHQRVDHAVHNKRHQRERQQLGVRASSRAAPAARDEATSLAECKQQTDLSAKLSS